MNISKSKYTRFCQCPKMFWLDKYHPELAEKDDAAEARMAEGNQVGELAKGYLGEYVDVTTKTESGEMNFATMIAKTKQCLADGIENICEATFSAGGGYCQVDILHKVAQGYAIYEVKASTTVKPQYLLDVAFQKWVLEQAGINVCEAYILHLNNKYEPHGTLDLQQFFVAENVWRKIQKPYADVERNVVNANNVAMLGEEPNIDLNQGCNKPYKCAYWKYCSKHLPQPSVFDLFDMDFSDKLHLYEHGIVSFEDVERFNAHCTARQSMQVAHELHNLPMHVNKDGIADFLRTLSYPLCFLDFETVMSAIPMFDGVNAYRKIPFQYSLHIVQSPQGGVTHCKFLGDGKTDPRRAIAESLVANIPNNACVLAYNMSFEKGCLKYLAQCFSDLSDHLLAICGNIKDLADVFSRGHVYNRAMCGKYTIKEVLPALFPNDPELNYHNLDGVHNGTEAPAVYLSLKNLPPDEVANKRKQLLEYCKLDTWAMVKLWQKLLELAK